MAGQEEFLDVQQVGKVLGVSPATVWRRIRAGELRSVLRAGRRLVPSTALGRARNRSVSSEVPAFDENHPIFRLVGAARSGGRKPGARDKHAVLDESE